MTVNELFSILSCNLF